MSLVRYSAMYLPLGVVIHPESLEKRLVIYFPPYEKTSSLSLSSAVNFPVEMDVSVILAVTGGESSGNGFYCNVPL